MSQGEDSNSKPFAIPPKVRQTGPTTQDDQAQPARSDNRPAESGREKENKPFLSATSMISAISLVVAALSLIFSLNQSHRTEVSQQRAELIDYVGKVATLVADDSGKNHISEIQALSSQAIALLPNVPDGAGDDLRLARPSTDL